MAKFEPQNSMTSNNMNDIRNLFDENLDRNNSDMALMSESGRLPFERPISAAARINQPPAEVPNNPMLPPVINQPYQPNMNRRLSDSSSILSYDPEQPVERDLSIHSYEI